MSFHGEKGTIVVDGSGYKMYDLQEQGNRRSQRRRQRARAHRQLPRLHQDRQGPNADIEEGHKSTLLCHLGNIAYRVNRVLTCSEKDGHIQNDAEAMKLWSREYRPGWEPKV